MKVALLTPYDGGNLGDAAIQEALIGNFRKYDPQVQLSGITLHPESTAARHHIPCYPLAAISRPYYHAKKEPAVSPNNYSCNIAAPEERRDARRFLSVLSERSVVSFFG